MWNLSFHLGARTDTVGQEPELYQQLNLIYSQRLWNICSEIQVPLLYASSAATYGNGECGFSDSHSNVTNLRPLNLYGWSKHDFDVWALKQVRTPPFWTGLKFFNVYGPNEYHKGRMASVVLHAYETIRKNGKMKLFRSHHKDYRDGQQSRDFILWKILQMLCCTFCITRKAQESIMLEQEKHGLFLI
jgi:ADP-L-glycero-D-manno-heptose 6-epimerase